MENIFLKLYRSPGNVVLGSPLAQVLASLREVGEDELNISDQSITQFRYLKSTKHIYYKAPEAGRRLPIYCNCNGQAEALVNCPHMWDQKIQNLLLAKYKNRDLVLGRIAKIVSKEDMKSLKALLSKIRHNCDNISLITLKELIKQSSFCDSEDYSFSDICESSMDEDGECEHNKNVINSNDAEHIDAELPEIDFEGEEKLDGSTNGERRCNLQKTSDTTASACEYNSTTTTTTTPSIADVLTSTNNAQATKTNEKISISSAGADNGEIEYINSNSVEVETFQSESSTQRCSRSGETIQTVDTEGNKKGKGSKNTKKNIAKKIEPIKEHMIKLLNIYFIETLRFADEINKEIIRLISEDPCEKCKAFFDTLKNKNIYNYGVAIAKFSGGVGCSQCISACHVVTSIIEDYKMMDTFKEENSRACVAAAYCLAKRYKFIEFPEFERSQISPGSPKDFTQASAFQSKEEEESANHKSVAVVPNVVQTLGHISEKSSYNSKGNGLDINLSSIETNSESEQLDVKVTLNHSPETDGQEFSGQIMQNDNGVLDQQRDSNDLEYSSLKVIPEPDSMKLQNISDASVENREDSNISNIDDSTTKPYSIPDNEPLSNKVDLGAEQNSSTPQSSTYKCGINLRLLYSVIAGIGLIKPDEVYSEKDETNNELSSKNEAGGNLITCDESIEEIEVVGSTTTTNSTVTIISIDTTNDPDTTEISSVARRPMAMIGSIITKHKVPNEKYVPKIFQPIVSGKDKQGGRKGAKAAILAPGMKTISVCVRLSFGSNVLLAALKLVAFIISGSMIMLASFLDSILDILSGVVLVISDRIAKKHNTNDKTKYPIGKQRINTIGFLIFACVMGTFTLEIIISSITTLSSGSSSVDFGVWPISILSVTIVLKFFLLVLCYTVGKKYDSDSCKAYAQDHRNDVLSNIVGLGFGLMTQFLAWWLDPTGSILISLYILINWVRTAIGLTRILLGQSASKKFLSTVIFVASNFSEEIVAIDFVEAFHSGKQVTVELHVVLPREMSLERSHDIGEALQTHIEAMDKVERCFVHVDVDSTHRNEKKRG